MSTPGFSKKNPIWFIWVIEIFLFLDYQNNSTPRLYKSHHLDNTIISTPGLSSVPHLTIEVRGYFILKEFNISDSGSTSEEWEIRNKKFHFQTDVWQECPYSCSSFLFCVRGSVTVGVPLGEKCLASAALQTLREFLQCW